MLASNSAIDGTILTLPDLRSLLDTLPAGVWFGLTCQGNARAYAMTKVRRQQSARRTVTRLTQFRVLAYVANWHRRFAIPTDTLTHPPIGQNHVRGFFRNHDDGGIGIARCNIWHDRRVHDS